MFSSPKPFPRGLSVGVNFNRTITQGYSSMTPQATWRTGSFCKKNQAELGGFEPFFINPAFQRMH